MGLVIYFVLTLFCGYMAFELGRYVIATGDALPLIIVLLLVLLSIHCIRQVYKAIKSKRPRYPRLNGRSTWNNREEGLGFYAGSWWGWFVLREGAPPNKGNQGKSLQSTKEIPSNQWEYLQSIGFLSKQG